MIESQTLLLAFGLTLLAGLSTGIGSLLACCAHHTNTKFLSVSLGFSAGVMIYVSFMDLLVGAQDALTLQLGDKPGTIVVLVAFFGGMLVSGVTDRLLPCYENPHECHHIEEMDDARRAKKQRKLLRLGLVTALAIALHNFPEGLATFAATLKSVSLGGAIALAIALHNIPEGIAISVPIYHATKSRKKAFIYSFASGLTEPLGAVLGYFVLLSFFNDLTMGILFAAIAGMMIFISLDQLLPAAREYGEHHLSIYGLVAGMATMAASLILFL